jgi:cell division protein ZapA
MKISHRIRLLGRDIQVRSSASAEAVQEVENFVNGKLAEVAASLPNADQQLVTLLALLNVAESYLAARRDEPYGQSPATDALQRIAGKIDSALGEDTPRRVDI